MEFNLNRHKLLEKLADKFNSGKNLPGDGADLIGLKDKQIDDILGSKSKYRDLILSELWESKEIHDFDLNGKGIFITPLEGLSALSSKKYIKRNWDIILKWIKNFLQIVIPILSLAIAFLALTLRFNSMESKIEQRVSKSYDSKIQHLQQQLDSIKRLENINPNIPNSEINKSEK